MAFSTMEPTGATPLAQLLGADLAFTGLATLLSEAPEPGALDALVEAARLLAGSDAAWLLLREAGEWRLAGRASAPGARPLGAGSEPVRMVPLRRKEELLGLLAFRKADDGAGGEALESDFERALAAALSTQRERDAYAALALHDPLTGLWNRRALEQVLGKAIAQARRDAQPLCVALLDLDHFKAVNDRHGHDAGDVVLRACARALGDAVRASDSLFRYGGEEFLAVLPGTAAPGARQAAEKLRLAVKELAVACGAETVSPTVSVGVAELGATETGAELLRRADEALYAAKREGRDRVTLAGAAPEASP